MWLFYYFYFEKNCGILKSKSPCFLLNKNINFKKTKWNWKWKIPHTVLERWTMAISSYKDCELKVKLWCVGARERKKGAFFITYVLFCRKGIFLAFVFYLNVYCIENTFRIYILLHVRKHYFIHFCCLSLKSSKAFILFL